MLKCSGRVVAEVLRRTTTWFSVVGEKKEDAKRCVSILVFVGIAIYIVRYTWFRSLIASSNPDFLSGRKGKQNTFGIILKERKAKA